MYDLPHMVGDGYYVSGWQRGGSLGNEIRNVH